MGMRVHELQAAMVHAPIAILPTAAAVDLVAAITGSRRQARLGRRLWWAGATAGLLAGLGGMAASQEVKVEDEPTSDMLWLHGVGNLGLVLGAFGIAAWRSSHKPTVTEAAIGLAACGLSFYTAYPGGEMVYGRGVGVRSMPRYTATGVADSPPVLSRAAPGTFLRDAVRGLRWLIDRTGQALAGRKPIQRAAFGLEEASRAPLELDS
jgi:uncharacterized membrane protein